MPTPLRIPTPVVGHRDRIAEVRAGLLGVVGLLVVVVGVPAALILLIGNPVPARPSLDWLVAEVTPLTVFRIIAVVIWLAWAHFVVCLLSEWQAARRGVGLPPAVPMGGGSQLLARRLVAAVLLLAGAATMAAPQAMPATTAAVGVVSTSQVDVVAETARSSAAITPSGTGAADPQAVTAAVVGPAAVVDAAAVVTTYTVQPPAGRQHDCLWDIAERTLGDPLRYREIFALNADRLQPDGRRLVDADLINPGWQLLMPADASGPGITVIAPPAMAPVTAEGAAPQGVVAPQAVEQPAQAPLASVPVADVAPGTADVAVGTVDMAVGAVDLAVGAVDAAGAAGPADPPAVRVPGDLDLDLGTLAGGGLAAAGLLLAITARRGPYVEPPDEAGQPAGSALAEFLQQALRELAAARAAQGRQLPEVADAYLSAQQLVLHLASGAAAADPPPPWTVDDAGRSWTLARADLPDAPVLDGPAPYPALVTIAGVAGHELLVDLETAPGIISIGGDLARARDTVVCLAVELATNSWSDGVDVLMVGFADDLTSIAPASLRTATSLNDVLDEIEADVSAHLQWLAALGASGVLAGRQTRAGRRWHPRVVLLSGAPSADHARRLNDLVAAGRTPLAVVCVGDTPGARWRFVVDAHGRIDLGVLGVSGAARMLSPDQYSAVMGQLRRAAADRVERSATVAALTPDTATASVARPGDNATAILAALRAAAREDTGPGPRDTTPAWADPRHAAAEVRLLGPVTVEATGPVDDSRRALLTEVVVAAALHRDGLHDAVLRATVWPRGADDDVVAATVADAQAWLGRARDGLPRFRQTDEGRWRLSDDVRCDVDVMTALAATRGGDELIRLRTALTLIRGEAFSQTPPQRYGWLAFARSARDARVVGTTVARRAATLATAGGRPDHAVHALRAGIALVPTAETLWRDLLRLVGTDDPAAALAVVGEMDSVLARHRISAEPQTDALVARLAPGRQPAAG